MDILIHVHYDKCLFNCDAHLFNDKMSKTLTKLFSLDVIDHIYLEYVILLRGA